MSVTVGDCMRLPALREARVVAGTRGLNRIVDSISVLEYADVSSLIQGLFMGNELVITGLVCIKDDPSAQCEVIRHLHEMGEIGLILYYVGIFLPKLDDNVVQTAEELDFPLIVMPENRRDLRYSEVISEVMEAIFRSRMQETQFVNEMLERISQLETHQRTIETVLRIMSDRIHCSILLTDRSFSSIQIATWPMSAAIDAHEVLARYRNSPGEMLAPQSVKLVLNGKEIYAQHQSILLENGLDMSVIILSEATVNSFDISIQTAEVIKLFMNIWKFNQAGSGCADLFRAIMNDEPVKMRRLAEILHVDVASIHIMWVLKILKRDLTQKEKTALNTELLIRAKDYLRQHHRVAMADVFEDSVIGFMNNPEYIY